MSSQQQFYQYQQGGAQFPPQPPAAYHHQNQPGQMHYAPPIPPGTGGPPKAVVPPSSSHPHPPEPTQQLAGQNFPQQQQNGVYEPPRLQQQPQQPHHQQQQQPHEQFSAPKQQQFMPPMPQQQQLLQPTAIAPNMPPPATVGGARPPMPTGPVSGGGPAPPFMSAAGARPPAPPMGMGAPPPQQYPGGPPPPPTGGDQQQQQHHFQQYQRGPMQQQHHHYPGPQYPGPGQQQQQPKKIDPNSMPSQPQVVEDDRRSRTGLFETGYPTAELPPLATTDFFCQMDQANCNPKFMRSTLYSVPANGDAVKSLNIPFGISVTPMAELEPNEAPPPIVDLGPSGPVRCQRCKAYICSLMEFHDGGRRFRCPFCRTSTDVPEHYFAHLDNMGRRTDLMHRPELYRGSYELVATSLYCKNGLVPEAPAFIFMLDVSYNAVSTGLVKIFCQNIRRLLDDLPRDYGQESSNMKVGFATYDQTIQFYNLKNVLEQPQMMVVTDVADVFVPAVDGFLVSLDEAGSAIETLMNLIPQIFGESRVTATLLGPAIQAGMDALKSGDRAGKLFVFHSSLPTFEAPGSLKNRDDRKLLGTDKEKTLLTPQTDFYAKLGQEGVTIGCCVDVFLFPNSYIDVATIGEMCSMTGGAIYKYQYFDAAKDGERFLFDLQRDICRPIIFDVMMRMRTSTGIRPTEFYGAFTMPNTTDIEVAAFDCHKALNVEIKYDDKLDEQSAYIQAAILFTSCSGQRRLRIHNLALPVLAQTDFGQLFRMVDQDTIVSFLTKHAARLVRQKSPRDVREYLSSTCTKTLAAYREKVSENSPVGQLILPENLKLMPLYTNCIQKNDALAGAEDITTDDRAWMLSLVPSLRPCDMASFLYPTVLCLEALFSPATSSDEIPADAENLRDNLSSIRGSYENLDSRQMYIVENGMNLFIWIGLGVNAEWIQDVFGVSAVSHIDVEKHILPEKDTTRSRSLRCLIDQLHKGRARRMKVHLIRQGEGLEVWMKKYLVEDKPPGHGISYVDFLVYIHREIRQLIG